MTPTTAAELATRRGGHAHAPARTLLRMFRRPRHDGLRRCGAGPRRGPRHTLPPLLPRRRGTVPGCRVRRRGDRASDAEASEDETPETATPETESPTAEESPETGETPE